MLEQVLVGTLAINASVYSLKIIEVLNSSNVFLAIFKSLIDTAFHDGIVRFNMCILLGCRRFCKFLSSVFSSEVFLYFSGDKLATVITPYTDSFR